jgi:hypothetical protein
MNLFNQLKIKFYFQTVSHAIIIIIIIIIIVKKYVES